MDRVPPGTPGERVLGRQAGRARDALSLARGEGDVRAAQALRFLVFNLELHEGLETAFAFGQRVHAPGPLAGA